jgi:hypothetical protein
MVGDEVAIAIDIEATKNAAAPAASSAAGGR